jgi:hypothetical protein
MVMWRLRTLDYANLGKTRKTYLALLNWGRGRISQTRLSPCWGLQFGFSYSISSLFLVVYF